MSKINANFTGKDQNWSDGTTVYWFEVNGEAYGVVHSGESWNSKVVDSTGNPTDRYSVEEFNITDKMIAE
ncbi:hypothetical protein [Candidatus Pantoea deserta]|uniref:hypothetical protein n=1 Tax=Candidatus Pantoea deserta TaxID=1869313 RepID=UPI000F50A949|nr:hypothetical protein [Pantoea deserta]